MMRADPLDGFVGMPILQQKAGAIRALAKNVARDIVEIGRHLTEAKAACTHGEWLPWLESEFAWSRQTADNFINVYQMSKSLNFSNLPALPVSSLYALAAPSTPEPARAEVIQRAESGETLSRAEVDALIAKAKAEAEEAKARAEARVKDARETAQRAEKRLFDLQEREAKSAAEIEAKAREDAAAEVAALRDELDAARKSAVEIETRAKTEAEAKIAEALAAASKADAVAQAAAEKAVAELRDVIEGRNVEIERLNAAFAEARNAAMKAERASADEAKRFRREVAEAGVVMHAINDSFAAIEKAPRPDEAARRARKQLSHAINASKAREAGQWLIAFADAWESETEQ